MMKPKKTEGMDVSFGLRSEKLATFLVPKQEIPDVYWGFGVNNDAVKTVEQMFFFGGKFAKLTPKDGVDKKAALSHIRAIMSTLDGSFPHEYKTACCAYLLDTWFSEYEFQSND